MRVKKKNIMNSESTKSTKLIKALCLFLVLLTTVLKPQFVSAAESTWSVHLQEDGFFSSESLAQWTGPRLPELFDFTVCLRMNINYLRGAFSYVVSYATDQDDNSFVFALANDGDLVEAQICKHKHVIHECLTHPLPDLNLQTWTHFCVSLEAHAQSLATTLQLFVDGELAASDRVQQQGTESYKGLTGGGSLVLGQEQDSIMGGFDWSQSFSGALAQLNIWDRVLSPNQIWNMSKCESNEQGNIVDWQENNWQIYNARIDTNVSIESLCRASPVSNKMILAYPVSHPMLRSLCDILEARIPVVINAEHLDETQEDFVRALYHSDVFGQVETCMRGQYLGQFLLGQIYDKEKELWVDPYVSNVSDVLQLRRLEERESCAFSTGNKFRMGYAERCDIKIDCAFCYMRNVGQRWLKLKGLCKEDVEDELTYDTDYYVWGARNNKPLFKGRMNSQIYFDAEVGRWRLQSLRSPSKSLLMASKNANAVPVGTKTWVGGANTSVCGQDDNFEKELTLSSCFPNMYTCNSGQCIELSKRCDTELDCPDKSDEYDCDYLKFGPNYAKELIPRDEKGETLIVYMNVSVLAFPFIDSVKLKLTSDFFLNLRWYDLRIDFRDLNEVASLNSLSEKDRENIWTPRLAFVNALGPFQTVVDELTSGILIREDAPLPEDLSLSTEAMLFSGRSNSISMRREYYQDYRCDFNLRYYPFDTQMCTMIFEIQDETDNYVRLERDGAGIEFLGGRVLVEYEIQMEDFQLLSVNRKSRAQVKIVFRRRMEYHVTNTFLQTFILVGIGFMSLFFPVDNFTDRIMVALTTMLVVATITTSIQDNLPKTSYYKLIDWWLLYSINMLVLTMGLHTYVTAVVYRARNEHFSFFDAIKKGFQSRRTSVRPTNEGPPSLPLTNKLVGPDEKKDLYEQAKRVNFIGKIAFILIVLVVNLIFWTIALAEYLKPAEEYL